MWLRSIILAMALCVTFRVAHAQPIQGIYVGAGAGGLLPFPIRNTPIGPGIGGDFDLKQKLGFDTQLSVGYALGNGWRFELEGTYGRATVNGFSDTLFPAAGTGAVRNMGIMANALFDLDVGSPYVYPYLGLGAGYQSTRLDGFALTSAAKPITATASGQAGGFAAQAIGGLAFPIPNMPGLSLTVDYRIMDILGGETFNGTTSFGPGSLPTASGTKFHNQFDQIVMFGVRYAFNTPRPAAVASTATAPTSSPAAVAQLQTYLVSFEPDQATLSGRARGIVNDAAMSSTGRQDTRIELTGQAGTSGGQSLNPALSERRAKAVAAALIGDGVPKEAIAVHARRDTNPAIPTGPGEVRQQNRRVEIVTE